MRLWQIMDDPREPAGKEQFRYIVTLMDTDVNTLAPRIVRDIRVFLLTVPVSDLAAALADRLRDGGTRILNGD